VCRPSGTIGLASFTPDGGVGEFLGVFAPYLPAPPPGSLPPVLWGDEEHVRELFDDRAELELERRWLVERSAGGPREYCDFYRETFGPAVAAYAAPGRAAAVDRDFLDFATRMNRGADAGPSEYHYEYLLVVARKR
jgi:2-polyprenyl-6-hydroxyphenyl methylase/3-demethylubiquinone-9 3-methyltransferase